MTRGLRGLVYDDFEGEALGAVPTDWTEEAASTRVAAVAYQGNRSIRCNGGNNRAPIATTGNQDLSDLMLSAYSKEVGAGAAHGCDLGFRFQAINPLDNHYFLSYYVAGGEANTLGLYKRVGGVQTRIAFAAIVPDQNWHKLSCIVYGWRFKGFLDDAQLIPATLGDWQDLTGHDFRTGKVGVRAWWSTTDAYFDVFTCMPYPPSKPRTKPRGGDARSRVVFKRSQKLYESLPWNKRFPPLKPRTF